MKQVGKSNSLRSVWISTAIHGLWYTIIVDINSEVHILFHSQSSQRTLIGRQNLKCSFLLPFRGRRDWSSCWVWDPGSPSLQFWNQCSRNFVPCSPLIHSFTGIGQTYCSCNLNFSSILYPSYSSPSNHSCEG